MLKSFAISESKESILLMPNCSTKTLTTLGERKAGRTGPR